MFPEFENPNLLPTPEDDFNPAELLHSSRERLDEITPLLTGDLMQVESNFFLESSENLETSTVSLEADEITGMTEDQALVKTTADDPLTGKIEPRYVTPLSPNKNRYLVEPGEEVNGLNLDGVARIEDSFFGDLVCSGTLLPTGKHILTASHCIFEDISQQFRPRDLQVTFNLPSGDVTKRVSEIFLHPDYDENTEANDIAILELASAAPNESPRYEIYRDGDELGLVHLKVGYGATGQTKVQNRFDDDKKRVGFNVYDVVANELDERFFDEPGSIPNDTQLAYDFDNGEAANDAFGEFFNIQDTGLGDREVNSAEGDSGGPTFIDGKIAGLVSYGFGANAGVTTDIDNRTNSSFGEISVDTRVSAYTDWIDGIVGTSAQLDTDFNGDGNIDLLLRNSKNGKNQIWLMEGSQRVDTVNLPTRHPNWELVDTSDFDGDGNIDLLLRNSNNGKNQVWLMEGSQRVDTVNLPTRHPNWELVGSSDFDDDGNSDLLWRNSKNGKNRLWLMDGSERVGTVNLPTRHPNWEFVSTSDFDGDGNIDLLLRNSKNGKNQVWLMEGSDRAEVINLPTRHPNWEFIGSGDFDKDGNIDLWWRNGKNGKNQVWLMDGSERVGAVNLPARTNTDWEAIV